MMVLSCPWCGPRNVTEFRYGGENRSRPDPATASPAQWRGYLFMKSNPMGEVGETWYHRAGCRRYFTLDRDTRTNASRRPEATR